MNILELSHVSKTFGNKTVVSDISFAVPKGSIYGFIGQNGAGKTTTMKMILGLLQADSGTIHVNNQTVSFGENHTNQSIGYLPDVPEFYGFMTPAEYLTLCGEITGMSAGAIRSHSSELLEMVGLSHVNKRIHGFSRGMKQRLGIAQALLNSPKLLICDEPTSALDPVGRKEILDILRNIHTDTTVLFSTHILSDVERICDKIAFLHNGSIALEGTLEEIKSVRNGNGLLLEFRTMQEAQRLLTLLPGGILQQDTLLRYTKKNEKDVQTILNLLVQNDISPLRLEVLEPTLEDLFMEVVSK